MASAPDACSRPTPDPALQQAPQPAPQAWGSRLLRIAGVAIASRSPPLDKPLSAETVRQRPGLRLRQAHQRRQNRERPPDAQPERGLQRIQRLAPAVGIAGRSRSSHIPPTRTSRPASIGGQLAAAQTTNARFRPGTKVEGRPRSVISMARSAVRADSPMAPKARRFNLWSSPNRAAQAGTARASARRNLARLQLLRMPLAVVEANGLDPLKAVERPGQADGRVLAARQEHESRFHGFGRPGHAD